ncbi:MAG: SIMPL domain-containing protein [Selenomonadaceae bacterium]|nr:SIMPL domain-containing protein [Selenomonadaceae bacterium]
MKSFMGFSKVLTSVFCGSLLLVSSPASHASAAPQAHPVVIVTGSGVSSAAPDTANISLGVTTRADDTTAASIENAAVTAQVRAAVSSLGIKNSDIQTSHYNCYPEYGTDGKVVGYRVSNTLAVTVRDFQTINKVIDDSLKAGATEVSGLSFSLSDTSKLRSVAIKAAIADAKEKAEIIAASLGKSIIGIQTITESSSDTPRRYGNAMLMKTAAADTHIDGGELDYNATVTIHYYID